VHDEKKKLVFKFHPHPYSIAGLGHLFPVSNQAVPKADRPLSNRNGFTLDGQAEEGASIRVLSLLL